MRVVFLADAPYPHTRRWVQHFARRGWQCEVVSFRPAKIEGARVHHIGGVEPLGKARYLLHARRVAALVRGLQPDLLHALHLTSYGFLAALSGARPLLVSVWGTDILEAPRLSPFHAWLTRFALAHADRVTATGLHLATETARYLPPGRPVTVVPYGADLSLLQPRERPQRNPVVLGTAARLSPEKGIVYLIQAFVRLRRCFGEGVRLRIAGDTTPEPGGPERRRLERLARELGIAEATEFLGWIEPERLPAFLQELDIFVLPSIFEGFGVAAVEASAMALPVVASDVHGIPDVVRPGRTGLLVPPRDSTALAAALAMLVADAGMRHALGRAGREYVAERYDWQRNTRQMEAIYEQLLGGQREGRVVRWN